MKRHSFFLRILLAAVLLMGAAVWATAVIMWRPYSGGTGGMPAGAMWQAVGVAVAGALLFAVVIALLWYRPLRRMTRTARDIASGDLSARPHPFATSELEELGSALNDMRESLQRQVSTAAARGENLQTVVSNLREGVIATSASGEIVLVNKAATQLLLEAGADDATGRRIQSVVRVLDILDLYNRSQSSRQALKAQVQVELPGGRRNLEVHAIPLADPRDEGIAGLLVLHDVTDIARTGEMKAEFVANASHELRTPLAAIRGVADNLSELEPSDREGIAMLAGMLDRHVRRLEDLTRDLLDLHILESGRKTVKRDQITTGSLADWAAANFSQPAKAKGLTLDVQSSGEVAMTADRTLVELILQNLIDNAIKFTPLGGKVKVELSTGAGGSRIAVSDTGCGIEPAAQARVFERFFQTEGSRGGGPKVRGTGLGLAIVKHAVDRLGGKVTLQSQVGAGTTVAVELP